MFKIGRKLKLLSRVKSYIGESKCILERNIVEIKWVIWGFIL